MTNPTPESSAPSADLAPKYAPLDVEREVAARWTAANAFHAEPDAPGKPYAIVIPPPNVTAALHMGHALNNTLQDILTRYHRMLGDNTMWMPGTDHAGIATQTIVDKRLREEGQPGLADYKKMELEGGNGREKFLAKVTAWKDEYEAFITNQLKMMGCSCDWDRQRFTMDEVCAKSVREAFFQLFKDGLIYRGKRLVNWDPVSLTALADDEVEMEEIDGFFYYLKYEVVEAKHEVVEATGTGTSVPVSDHPQAYITVATTRPETMLGDTAVAINPRDPRAASLRGKFIKLPIVNRIIPIIEDDYVVLPIAHGGDPADTKAQFATGFLKVTPAHDPNDYEIGRRHNLPVINVMAPDASISKDHGWPTEEWPATSHDRKGVVPSASAGAIDPTGATDPTPEPLPDGRGSLREPHVDPFAHTLLGKPREQARKLIVDWFKKNDLLEEMKPYKHSVGHSYRSHVPVEPYLSDQWYVKVTDEKLAGAALKAMAVDQREPSATSHDRKGVVPSASAGAIDPTGATDPTPEPLPDGRGSLRESKALNDVAYFVTFSTYGSWLHGDERGSVDREHNEFGTPVLSGDIEREKREFQQLKHASFAFDVAHRIGVQEAIVEVCLHRGWRLHALHVRTRHVHCVVVADTTPERVMNDFKSYATRRLRRDKLVDDDTRVWTRHGSTRYLNEDATVLAAANYVIDDQGASLEPPPIDRRHATRPALTSPAVTSHDRKGVVPSPPVDPTPEPLPDGRGSLRESYENRLRFYPERYAKTFQQWHENIRDWCISRQLWWGHRIPVWTRHFENQEEYFGEPGTQQDDLNDTLTLLSEPGLGDRIAIAFVADSDRNRMIPFQCPDDGGFTAYVCLPNDVDVSEHYDGKPQDLRRRLEAAGFTQDPDVLDTWFSSGLWPISTLGWPDTNPALQKWNPSNTLCTAREIITLWVSRMVMFNIYFRGCLPFTDVFIHAMIQDGHGQKMSKTLGNGIDPLDIIHSHGSDAMRFTLASMTTSTQDVRMTVEMVCPHTQQAFTPKFIKDKAGYMVAAPIQDCPTDSKKKIVSSYGYASGKAKPTAEMPVARNTSEKFDYGRNFANKLWNAVRFALGYVKPTDADHWSIRSVADQWILARLARTVVATTKALENYEFKVYADTLYDFIWRDFCDWYIEAIKPTVAADAGQQRVLVTVIDVILRMLHPAMPFITEKLWDRLNIVAPKRTDLTMDGLFELKLGDSELLVKAPWPKAKVHGDGAAAVEARFESIRQMVSALREVRTSYKVAPKVKVDCAIKSTGPASETLGDDANLIATLANVRITAMGSQVEKAADAASTTVGELELYLAGLIDKDQECARFKKMQADLDKSIAAMRGRLGNAAYTDKAPAHLVQQTRDQLAALEKELETITQQSKAMGCG